MRLRLLVAIAMLSGSLAAHADIIYNLSGVTLANGGTLTGTFTTNNADTVLMSANIVASKIGNFPGFTYTLPGDTNASVLPSYLQINFNGATDTLRFYFTGGLKATGTTTLIAANSYEAEPTGGNRVVTAGSVVVQTVASQAPEPSSLILLGTGLLGAVGIVRRRLSATV